MAFSSYSRVRLFGCGIAAVLGAGLVGCSALDVTDPTKFRTENLENSMGVDAAVKGVRYTMMYALYRSIMTGGIVGDEIMYGGTGDYNSRNADTLFGGELYMWVQRINRNATIAIPLLEKSAPASVRGPKLAEVFSYRGYSSLLLAEEFCPGYPRVKLAIDGEAVTPLWDSDPQTSDSSFLYALADFDSALTLVGDSVRIRNLALVGKARALVGLGRFSEAGAAAAQVDAGFADSVASEYGLYFDFLDGGYMAGDREGGNGLDYATANDPRVVVEVRDVWGTMRPQPMKYITGDYFPYIVFASDIEARLIEAEAQLAESPNGPEWLATLNELRGRVALNDTTDPGTPQGRVDLLFRERAFWLYLTAHRLGDMRRLIARYGRDPETVFPTGTSPEQPDISYGPYTSVAFNGVAEHDFNPKITGCTGY